MKIRSLFSVLMVGLLGLGASIPIEARPWIADRDVEIEIVDDSGREFLQHPVRGNNNRETLRAYVEAERGENYAIRVRNHSGHRIGLVIAVDGRNILSGEKSHLARSERKYILNPDESSVYQGWRTSRSRVHRFYFTDAADSYAEAFGDRTAMGVIAVAVYREKVRRHEPLELKPHSDTPQPRLGRRGSAHGTESDASRPGTGFGESEWSPSRRVAFQPEEHPSMQRFLKYEWRKTLCRKGVISCHRPHPRNRFWPDDEWADENGGFAPYPPRDRFSSLRGLFE